MAAMLAALAAAGFSHNQVHNPQAMPTASAQLAQQVIRYTRFPNALAILRHADKIDEEKIYCKTFFMIDRRNTYAYVGGQTDWRAQWHSNK